MIFAAVSDGKPGGAPLRRSAPAKAQRTRNSPADGTHAD
jgi:hypothetical protein